MLARAVGWLSIGVLYAAAQLALGPPVRAVQAPRLLEELGPDARVVVLAAFAAGAFALAAALARQTVPDPWAWRASVVVALSPAGFELAGSAAAVPAALLAAGLLGALQTRDHPTRARTLGGAACLALAPWFGLAYALPAGGVLLVLAYWSFRRGRRLYAFLALEFAGASAVTLGAFEVSRAVGPAPGLERVGELLAGAPLLAVGLLSLGLVARARRDRLSRAIPAWRDAEVAIALLTLATGATALAALLEPIGPEAAVPIAAALAALALRGARRVGALLAAATLALALWRAVELVAGTTGTWLPA